jgi:hypothetical protein
MLLAATHGALDDVSLHFVNLLQLPCGCLAVITVLRRMLLQARHH